MYEFADQPDDENRWITAKRMEHFMTAPIVKLWHSAVSNRYVI